MFCPNCGSPIPDGSRFCTECGTPVAPSDAPETPAENAPTYAAPAETAPAYTAPAEPTPAYAAPVGSTPAPTAPANEYGYSVVGGGASAGAHVAAPRRQTSPEIESKPLTRRWWFWLIVGLVVVAVIIAIAASVFAAKKSPAPASESASSNSLRASVAERTAAAPEAFEPEPAQESDGTLTLEECMAEIERDLTAAGYYCELEADEDDWVYAYIWFDGINDLANDAYNGDRDALAEWEDLLSEVIDLSAEYADFFADHGQPQAVSYVALQDEVDTDLLTTVAIDGELIFDVVTDVDIYDLAGE